MEHNASKNMMPPLCTSLQAIIWETICNGCDVAAVGPANTNPALSLLFWGIIAAMVILILVLLYRNQQLATALKHQSTPTPAVSPQLEMEIAARQKLETALKQEHNLLERLLETLPIGIVIMDDTGLITFANTQAEQILGLAKTDVIQRAYNAPDWHITDIEGHPFPDNQLPFLQVKTSQQQVAGVEHAIQWPDGRRVLLSINAAPLISDEGEFNGMVAAIENISERHRAEYALQTSEQKYRQLFENLTVGFALHEMIYDDQGKVTDFRYLEVNPMFEKLTGIPADQIIGKRAREQTRADIHAPGIDTFCQIAQVGKPVSYENYSRELNRYYDTRVFFPAQDQFAVIFTDITERKQTEQQIHKLNRMLRVLNEVNQALVRATDETALIQQVCQIIVDLGGYRLAWVGWAENDVDKTVQPAAYVGLDTERMHAIPIRWDDSEYGRGPTGTAIRIGQPIVINDLLNDPRFTPWLKIAQQEGYASAISLPLRAKGRVFGALSIYTQEINAFDGAEIKLLTEMADDLAYGIVSLRTQIALQTSEQKYRHLFENMTAGFALHEMIYDAQGQPADYRYLEANPAFERLTGVSASALLGKTVKEVMPNTEQYWIETYGKVAKTGKPIAYENYARELGKYYDVWAFSPAPDQFAVIFTDITERKQTEQQIRKLNRMLRVLNEVNEKLVRAEDELELIQQVCQTIVDLGGYRLAWVGWAEMNTEKTIRPIASAGYDASYVNTLKITWADTELGHGPSGQAVHLKQPVVFSDLRTHPDFAPWRELALQNGYASVISLPLLSNKKQVLGILSIYASEVDAFDDAEIRMLEEMADDLAYGIVSLRTQVDHRRIETALEASEARYRSIFEVSPDGIMLHHLDSRLITANQQAARLFGYNHPDELLALEQNVFDAVVPEDHSRLQEQLQQLMEVGQVRNARFTVFRRDQSRLPVEINAAIVRGTDGKPVAYTTVTRDITEQLRAEHEITAWQMRYELVAIASNQVVYECDLRQGWIIWGGSLEQVLGYHLGEMNGLLGEWEDLISPEDRGETLRLLSEAGKNETDFQAEYDFKHKDGHYIRILDRGFFMPTPASESKLLIGVMQDITERQQAEQQHLELVLERERNETFRQLVGNIAHDIKTPLAAINTSLYLYTKHTDPDKRQEKLDNIQTQTRILGNFIQDLMTIVRLDGEPEFILSPIDLNELIATIEPDFLSQVEQKRLNFTLTLEQNLPLVQLDANLWRRVLTNLIENAINYTPSEQSVHIQTARQDEWVVFTVEDTGIGISEADLPHIFNRFYRSDQARAMVEGGSGLGLAIVKRVVEMHGGHIEVESQVGVGSRFRVFLPISNT